MNNPIHFKGVLTTTTPMHVADPVPAKLSDDNKIGNVGKPLTRTIRLGVVLPGPGKSYNDEGTDDNPSRNVFYAPYFPSNDLRGRMRRKAARRMLEHLAENGQPVPLPTYHCLSCGSATHKPSSKEPSISKIESAREDLFAGVFGGGPYLLMSRFTTYDMYPITQNLMDRNLIDLPPNLSVEPVVARFTSDLTDKVHVFKVDDVVTHRDANASQYIENYRESVYGWQEKIAVSRAVKLEAVKNEAAPHVKAEKVSLGNMVAREVISPGVPFNIRFSADGNLSDAQLGLLVLSMMDIANEQALGGHVTKGYGRFTLDLHGELNGKWLPVFEYDEELQTYTMSEHFSYLEDAFSQELLKVTSDSLNEVYSE